MLMMEIDENNDEQSDIIKKQSGLGLILELTVYSSLLNDFVQYRVHYFVS